jgi:uncharacterized membrane protein
VSDVQAAAIALAIALGAGFACGLRTLSVPAMLSVAIGSLAWRILFIAGAVVELVGDLLPSAPSRLAPAGLLFRCVAGGASAAVIAVAFAHASRDVIVAAVALGIAGALAGAFVGAGYRRAVATAKLPDWPFAIIEDVVAYSGAFALVLASGRALAG